MDEDQPPPPQVDVPTLSSGGIYVRWQERLWQEQPDGSYLLWDETTRQWVVSTLQPPAEGGKAIVTRECPNCAKRVKSSLRSCPHCGHVFEVANQPTVSAPEPRSRAQRSPTLSISPIVLLIGLLLAAAIGVGVFLKLRSASCENWKAGVRSYTEFSIREKGLPRGLTEQDFRVLNEQRFADTRPGGCG